MDIFRLELELTSFLDQSVARWRIRRIFIGFLLFFYYMYAGIFFFIVAFPQDSIHFYSESSQVKAPTQTDQQTKDLGQESTKVADQNSTKVTSPVQSHDPKQADLKPIPPLVLMVTFGFIGGVFSITQTFVRTTERLVDGRIKRNDLPVSWYLTRPLQSALMAIFIYYAFRAGQLVFYSMEGAPDEKQINVFTLSLLAIIAGAFSEQAFDKLRSIATNILKVNSSDK